MAALRGRTVTAAAAAWVWFGVVTVARLGTAQETPSPVSEPRGLGGFLPVTAWKSVTVSGAAAADWGRPQVGCGDAWLSVRWSPERHSDLRLEDGRSPSSLADGCGASVQSVGSRLLLKLPYRGCPVESWVSNGTRFHQLKLRYFDHLLQEHVAAAASCRDAAPRPSVRCGAADVTVRLPPGTELQRVRALGRDGAVGTALGTGGAPDAELVRVSTATNTDSLLEMQLLDAAGETSTMLAACWKVATGLGRERRRRAPPHPNLMDPWDFDVVPLPFGSYHQKTGTCTTTSGPACVVTTTARPSCVATTTSGSACVATTT